MKISLTNILTFQKHFITFAVGFGYGDIQAPFCIEP